MQHHMYLHIIINNELKIDSFALLMLWRYVFCNKKDADSFTHLYKHMLMIVFLVPTLLFVVKLVFLLNGKAKCFCLSTL